MLRFIGHDCYGWCCLPSYSLLPVVLFDMKLRNGYEQFLLWSSYDAKYFKPVAMDFKSVVIDNRWHEVNSFDAKELGICFQSFVTMICMSWSHLICGKESHLTMCIVEWYNVITLFQSFWLGNGYNPIFFSSSCLSLWAVCILLAPCWIRYSQRRSRDKNILGGEGL